MVSAMICSAEAIICPQAPDGEGTRQFLSVSDLASQLVRMQPTSSAATFLDLPFDPTASIPPLIHA